VQKVGLIVLLTLLFSGCSVVKLGRGYQVKEPLNGSNTIEQVMNQNITNESFYISKCEINITSEDGRESVIGTVKFEKPDKFLISIRSKTGIEVARMYIDNDTILVNDRFNKTLYYGSGEYLRKKYGITAKFLPLIFGDLIIDGSFDLAKVNCKNEDANALIDLDGNTVNCTIDCKSKKLISVRTGKILNNSSLQIYYSDFINNGNILFPSYINIEGILPGSKIEIVIKKIESPWNGAIEFIPGNKYTKVEL